MSNSLFNLRLPEINHRLLGTSALILGTLLPTALMASSTAGVELPNGQTAFSYAPRLIKSSSSFDSKYVPSTYYFTLRIPENAGEPLKAVQIVQRDNVETIQFQGNATRASLGTRFAKTSTLPLAAVGGRAEPGEMTVVFDPPVQPGNTVTVALKSERNPTNSGVYLFGVTAYPAGENSIGQFLGYGRLHFYNN